MVILEESAKKELDAYFEGKEKSPIRIYLAPGGCSGPVLALALNDANDDDSVAEVDGYTFVMHNTLFEQIMGVTIAVGHGGFLVTPDKPLPAVSGGGGSCGSGCGGCGSSSSCCS